MVTTSRLLDTPLTNVSNTATMNNEVILPLGFVSKCHYCEEEKSFDDFVLDEEVPTNCRSHLAGDSTMICTDCMDESIKAQMYNKPLLEIGCPSCGDPWEFYVVESLVHDTTLDELKTLESSMRDRTLVPEEIPDDGASTQLLLDQGARFW